MTNHTKVLVVDDNETIRHLFDEILSLNGFDVSCCNDGTAAILLSKKERFDTVIVDFQMPGINGLEVTKSIRKTHPESIIIGISSDQKEKEFIEAGANTFFHKPFIIDQLVTSIKKRFAS